MRRASSGAMGKLRLFRNCRGAATLVIGGPFFGKIQLAIHQRRALVAGIAEQHADPTVLDAPRRAGVLALDPTECSPFFGKPVSSAISTASGMLRSSST
jgi:hypothetical protein